MAAQPPPGDAVGGHYVCLYALRKYGKTSLIQRALRDGAPGCAPGARVGVRCALARSRPRGLAQFQPLEHMFLMPTAQSALARLQAKADVEREGSRQSIVDP